MGKEDKNTQDFRVVDKRRYSGDEPGAGEGELGKEDAFAEQPEADPQTEPEDAEALNGEEQSEQYMTPDFPSFVVSLATQALVMLGEMPHPETNLVTANYGAAKQTIDILAMLEEKTKGNLSSDEEHLLTEVLDTLRMTFVRKVGGPRKAAE